MTRMRRPDKRVRQQIILGEARHSAALRVAELARHLGVSGETIRRDLDELGKAGHLRRIYGGATPPTSAADSAAWRNGEQAAALERMAAVVAGHVEPGQTVMISGGAAARHVAQRLVRSAADLTFITNELGIAAVAGGGVAEVVLCPGTYDAGDGSVQGEDTIEYLARFTPDLAIIASSALSASGASDALRGSANVKRAMLRSGARAMLIVERRHLGCPALQEIGPLAAFAEIITSGKPPPAIATACRDAGVRLTTA